MTAQAKKWLSILAGFLALIVLIVLAVFLARDSGTTNESVKTTPVQLSVDVPNDFKVGVIYSLTEDPNVETSWLNAAEGSQVAAYRIDPTGEDVQIYTKNDQGTNQGARSAVESLVTEGVSGIIVATSGPQAQVIADAAADEKIPTIFLYDGDVTGEGIWSFAPNRGLNHDVLAAALAERNYTHTIVFDSVGNLEDLASGQYYSFDTRTDLAGLADQVVEQLDEGAPADSIIIEGNSAAQLALIQELQTWAITLPVLLTSQAASLDFSDGLADFGINDGNFETVGVQSVDMLALASDRPGEHATPFFTALRLMNDGNRKNLLNEQQFGDVVTYADGISHDTLVSLARAAESARSSDAQDVLEALKESSWSLDDGLVTGAADFTKDIPNTNSLGIVRMTMQNLGLRDASETSTYWFAE